jgi:arylsulfatase A-like enzyme
VEHTGYKPFVLSGVSPEPPEATLEEYVYQRGIQFIQQQAARQDARPWALVLSSLGPHDPYIVPRQYFQRYDPRQIPQPASFHDKLEGRPAIYRRIQQVWKDLEWDQFAQAIACYYAFCSLIDDQVGRVLAALDQTGQAENTLVIYVSDHGDYMGAHRLMLKGIPAYDQAYRVPLIMAGPGIPRGKTISSRVNHLDLAASIFPLLGLDPVPPLDGSSPLHLGRSLLPLLAEDPQGRAAWSSQHFAECQGQRFAYTQRVLWWQNYKYVFNGFDQDEFYDLADDPDEMHNLAQDPARAGVIEDMAARMWAVMRQTDDKNMIEAEYGMFRFLPVGPRGRLNS